MLSISKAASVAYYLGRAGSKSETLGMTGPKIADKNSVGYYEAALMDDPLARKGRWGGKFAEELGLLQGSIVDARSFRNLCFGHHPSTRKPLHDGIASIEEQEAADAEMNRAERKVEMLRIEYAREREAARVSGLNHHDAPKVIEARKRLDEAESAKRGLSQSGKIRDRAHDLAFSVPKTLSCHLVALLAEARDTTDPKHDEKARQAKELEKLILDCVDKTMRQIESEWPVARPRENGTRIFQQMEGLAWANFLHFDARPTADADPEPHVHVHSTLMNIGRTYKGDMQALWTKYLADNIHTLGAHFRSELAQGLRAMGYELIPEVQDKVTSFRLVGMAKDEADSFSSRGAEVRENEGRGLGAVDAKTAGRQSKLASDEFDGNDFLDINLQRLKDMRHDSSTIKGDDKSLSTRIRAEENRKMEREWHAKNEAWHKWSDGGRKGAEPKKPSFAKPPEVDPSGKNMELWNKRIDARLEARGKALARLEGGISPKEILERCLEMETSFTLRDIERAVNEAMQFVEIPEGKTSDEIRRTAVARVLALPDLMEVQSATGPAGLGMDGMPIFTTRSQREREIELYGSLFPKLMDARDRLSLSSEDALAAIGQWERSKRASLADNQKATALDILTNSSGFQVVEGFAGSGKTFMAECSFKILKERGAKLYAMAPSTSAALLLKNEIGAAESFTPESLEAEIQKRESSQSNTKKEPPLIDKDTIVFLDEASMLDFKETMALVTRVTAAGGKIILSGDRKQLLSVGAGNVFKRAVTLATDKMERMGDSGPRLVSFLNKDFGDHDTIQRQTQSAGRQIVAWAETGQCLRALDALDRRGMIERHSDGDKMLERVAEERSSGAPKIDVAAEVERARSSARDARAGKLPKEDADKALRRFFARMDELSKFHSERLVVAETRKQVATVNSACRRRLKEAGVLGGDDYKMVLSDGRTIGVALGDRMAFTEKATTKEVVFRGDGDTVATKGTTGTVIDIRKGRDGKPQLKLLLDDRAAGGKDSQGRKRPWIWIDGDFTGLDHAYAMTVHRSQGQTSEHVQYIGSPKSSANLFLVGISRFKSTFKLHAHVGEIEGLKNAIAVEQRRIDATELGAAEYNLFDPDEVREYIDAAKELAVRGKKAMDALDEPAKLAEAEYQRRLGIARAVRMEKDGMAAMVLESVAVLGDRLTRRDTPVKPIPRDETLERDIEAQARRYGMTLSGPMAVGIARREGVPGALLGTEGKAETGDAKDKTPDIRETIYELAKLTNNRDGAGKEREANTGDLGALGSAARGKTGYGVKAHGSGKKKGPSLGSGGIASKIGGLRSLRERALDCYGTLSRGLLHVNRGDNLDARERGEAIGDRDDSLRQTDPSGNSRAGVTAQRPERPKWLRKLLGRIGLTDNAAKDWEWLGTRGPDVLARNLRSGQLELWNRAALEKAGRGDLIETAMARFGEITPATAEAEERVPVARGKIVGLGMSAFRDKEGNAILPHAVIEDEKGTRRKIWGAGLAAAISGRSEGDWVSVFKDRTEVVSLPVPAGTDGLAAEVDARVLKVGADNILLQSASGERWAIPTSRAAGFGAVSAGDTVGLAFQEMHRAVWEVEDEQAPNAILGRRREDAWAGISAGLAKGRYVDSLALMGLEADDAIRLWMKRSDDVVRWDHEEAGSRTWESLGWKEQGGRRFVGSVLYVDDEMAYLACSYGGKNGGLEAVADRIVAVPLKDIGACAEGDWLSLKAGQNGIERSARGDAAIVVAAEAGDTGRIIALLADGADIEARDKMGRSAVWMAAKAGNAEVLAILLDAGADPAARSVDGMTPLIMAAKSGQTGTVGILLDAGMDPEEQSFGWTAVTASKASRDKGCIKLVQEHCAARAKAGPIIAGLAKGRK